MWIHIGIFVLVLAAAAAWKTGLLPGGETIGKKGRRLFVAVALLGNLLGMFLTLEGRMEEDWEDGLRLKKEESGSYEAKLHAVFENGKETIYVPVPEKEGTGKEEPETPEQPDREETYRQELLAQIEELNEKKADKDYYYLPDTWKGRKLEWSKPTDTSGALLSGVCFLAALSLLAVQAQEGPRLLQKRREQLLMDYPALVMKFTLLVQAGMTARRAFQKMGTDYRKKKEQKTRPAYEEILTVCYEMESGVSEMEAYRRFGERCGQVKYKTFATLLVQNLQKGSRQLSDMLERESLEAWEERKRKARVLGEAAATKLLAPMVLMLLVVMAVIMVPAFLSFYGS